MNVIHQKIKKSKIIAAEKDLSNAMMEGDTNS